MYGTNSTARSFTGFDTIDLTPQDGITVAQYTPREYDVSIVISRRQKHQNSGKEQLIDLLKAKTDQAKMSLRDLMNQHAFAAQSGDNLDGLGTLINTSAGVVGGINESNESWWAPQRDTGGTTAADLVDNMRSIFNSCSQNKTAPDLILTTQTVHEIYESLVEGQGQFKLAEDNAALGFGVKNPSFRGVPVVWDGDATSGEMYFLNSEFLNLRVYKGADFDLGEMRQPIDQHAFARAIYWMGNLTTSNRRFQGIISSIS